MVWGKINKQSPHRRANKGGIVNVRDATCLQTHLTGGLYIDINGDDVVDVRGITIAVSKTLGKDVNLI